MRYSTIEERFPRLYAALFTLAIANQGVINPDYDFPPAAEQLFAAAESVLVVLTEEETETVVDGERGEAELIFARFGPAGAALDRLLEECFQGDWSECSRSPTF